MPHGDEQANAMAEIFTWKTGIRFIRPFLQPFVQTSVPVVRDGPLAEEFKNGKKWLQPLLFSHGLTSHKMNYSGLCREYASYGFLVIALNHNDRSCEFTTGKEVKVNDAEGNL